MTDGLVIDPGPARDILRPDGESMREVERPAWWDDINPNINRVICGHCFEIVGVGREGLVLKYLRPAK